MKVIRIGAVAALVAVTAGGAQAQQGERPRGERDAKAGHMGPRGGLLGQRLADSLGLTEAQRTQIRAIHERYRSQFQQLHASSRTHMEAAADARQRGDTAAARAHRTQARAAMEAKRTQAQQLRQTMQTELRAVLTPEQQARFDRFQALQRERAELRRDRMRERPGMRGPGARGTRDGARPGRGQRNS